MNGLLSRELIFIFIGYICKSLYLGRELFYFSFCEMVPCFSDYITDVNISIMKGLMQ